MPIDPLTFALGGGIAGAGGGLIQAIRAKKDQTRFRRRQRGALAEAERIADIRTRRVTEGELFQGAERFLRGTFEDAVGTPLAQDFAKGVRSAQAARGTMFGAAAEAGEASGLAAFAQQLRGSLLPNVLQFAGFGEQLRGNILASEAPLRVAAATGAPFQGLAPSPSIDPFSFALTQGIGGAVGGAQLGFAGQNLSLTERLLSQQTAAPGQGFPQLGQGAIDTPLNSLFSGGRQAADLESDQLTRLILEAQQRARIG